MKQFQTERVTQLEAQKVDTECSNLLKDSLQKSFQYFSSQTMNKYTAELSLLIDFIYFRETVSKNINLPGNQLQNIRYTAPGTADGSLSTKRKLSFFLVSVLAPYAMNKLTHYISRLEQQQHSEIDPNNNNNDQIENNFVNSKWFKLLKRVVEALEKLLKLANFVNFVAFLLQGKYRCISERICKIAMTYVNPQTARFLDFELQNRTILWGIVSDFIHFVLPLANDLSIFRAISKMFMFTTFLGSISSTDPTSEIESERRRCGICEDSQICMPRQIKSCSHRFCYYCIQTYLTAQAGQAQINCPKCATIFDQLIPITD